MGDWWGKDVTLQVRRMVHEPSQTVTFPAGKKLNKIFGDPHPGQPKQLKVLYALDGVEYRPARVLEAMEVFDQFIPPPGAQPTTKPPQRS
eukprot:CAMPEP_0117684414 /NCGR_PEP_ID=MMETSP0804-20121206/21078_1 /TAXON_ID=1074897 /ORGANISM="Tetraselmis astigmatica, Strain CCMP880" /LENGTH=89 /DNA_ID=CAMNT_0005495387 /DNA_START=323 /DNA_END=592 /DNA_ORIENTATION=+